jgi:glycosyltransferase involved in cell wall biosynthesis
MVRFYRLSAGRIRVVPEGVDTRLFRPLEDPAEAPRWRTGTLGADVPFVTYVGKPTERRNLAALIRAFGTLKRGGLPHRLLIVGADLPGDSPFRRVISELGLDREVVVRGYADRGEMAAVYNATDLLVYPSSYEGFGMPVLEAMACGTPVLAMNNTAFPEFAGGVALLLADARVETLATGIREALENRAWRDRAAVEGPRRAQYYDWRVITRRYLDLWIPLAQAWERR